MSKKVKTKLKKGKERVIKIDYQIGDLVGAKVKGFPLWPGRVVAIIDKPRRQYEISFFATGDFCKSKFDDLKPFEEFTDQEKSSTRKHFQEALALCQSEFNSRKASQEIKSSTQDQSTNASSFKTNKANDIEVKSFSDEPEPSKVQVFIKSNIADNLTTFTKSDTRCLSTQPKSPKSEGENTILAKLQGKVNKKMEEKEARKNELRESKLGTKASEKLPLFIKSLDGFSELTIKLSNGTGVREWTKAVPTHLKVLPMLAKCIGCLRLSSILSDQRKCYETILKLIDNLHAAENAKLPAKVRAQVRNCLTEMKGYKQIEEFLSHPEFGIQKNAMKDLFSGNCPS